VGQPAVDSTRGVGGGVGEAGGRVDVVISVAGTVAVARGAVAAVCVVLAVVVLAGTVAQAASAHNNKALSPAKRLIMGRPSLCRTRR